MALMPSRSMVRDLKVGETATVLPSESVSRSRYDSSPVRCISNLPAMDGDLPGMRRCISVWTGLFQPPPPTVTSATLPVELLPGRLPCISRAGIRRPPGPLLGEVVGVDDGEAHRELHRDPPEQQLLCRHGRFLDGGDAGVNAFRGRMHHHLIVQEEDQLGPDRPAAAAGARCPKGA